jgi:hypothetical protein
MVVWGGEEGSATLIGTGGRYDPTTDSWAPTSTIDAPSARERHTAVWTGRQMIVWGGGSSTVVSGGSYAFGSSTDGDGDGFASCQGDCNDGNSTVFPGAVEACDGLDDDCNGIIGDVDEDGDGLCVPLDCSDLDPQTQLIVHEVQGVVIEKLQPTRIHFASQDGSAGAGTSYDVAFGFLSDLQAAANFAQAACVGNVSDTPAQDAGPDPGIGQGYYYLVRAKNACGAGGWGQASDGSSRIVTACP